MNFLYTRAVRLRAAINRMSLYLMKSCNLLSKLPCKKSDFRLIAVPLSCTATVFVYRFLSFWVKIMKSEPNSYQTICNPFALFKSLKQLISMECYPFVFFCACLLSISHFKLKMNATKISVHFKNAVAWSSFHSNIWSFLLK